MKVFATALTLFALLNFSLLEYGTAGEVQRIPLDIGEMVTLTQEQAADFGETKEVEAGLANGYGLMALAFAIGVGYLISREIDKDNDDNKKSTSSTGTSSSNTTTTTTSTTDSGTGETTSTSSTATTP